MTTTEPATPERRQSATLILDIFGMYVRRLGGWISAADLVSLMEDLGVASGPTRSAVSRMARAKTLARVSQGQVAGYSVAAEAEPAMSRADLRIYSSMAPADLADGWIVVLAALPESQRSRRDLLRKELTWLGFGNLGNGVWIAPARAREELLRTLASHDDPVDLQIFESHHLGMTSTSELISNAWDLDALDDLYRGFLASCDAVLDRWDASDKLNQRTAFIDHTNIVHAWRKFPYLDPGLPQELLPKNWICPQAVQKFHQIVASLEAPAMDYVANLSNSQPASLRNSSHHKAHTADASAR